VTAFNVSVSENVGGNTPWLSVAYALSNFTADGSGIWEVPEDGQETYAYKVLNYDTMILAFKLTASRVRNSPASLLLKIPGNYESVRPQFGPFHYWDAFSLAELTTEPATIAPPEVGLWRVDKASGGDRSLILRRGGSKLWTTTTAGTYLLGQAVLNVRTY
jgi:hypothetical protein